jgi:predicted MFS family arabinose efflux permease
VIAIGTFLASFIGGILWQQINPSATFYYGSIMALTAFIVFMLFQKEFIKAQFSS